MAREQRRDIKFLRAVEAAVSLRDLLPEQAIAAHDLALWGCVIDDDQMVADRIKAANIPTPQAGIGVGNCMSFFKENAITQFLRLADFLLRDSQFELKLA